MTPYVAPPASTCYAIPGDGLTYTLTIGMCSTEVITLQQMLNKLGFTVASAGDGSPGREVMNFGKATKAAVAKFQQANGITTDALGVVGPATRTKLQQLAGQ
jgi:peptidoglycan hydrolase-like protein with peptidoglycan-binding domain